MKKYAVVFISVAFAITMAIGNASAGGVDSRKVSVPDRNASDATELSLGNCISTVDGAVECDACEESEEHKQSACTRLTFVEVGESRPEEP